MLLHFFLSLSLSFSSLALVLPPRRTQYIHAFTDGRDTLPKSATGFVQRTVDRCAAAGYGELATVVGRYYAMDRDRRWERVDLALSALLDETKGEACDDAVAALERGYAARPAVTDEFVLPLVMGGSAASRVRAGDTLIFFDFRADRMREIVGLLTGRADTGGFEFGAAVPAGLSVVCMTEYRRVRSACTRATVH